jgi:lysyl-tRNA synthetase class II
MISFDYLYNDYLEKNEFIDVKTPYISTFIGGNSAKRKG